MNPWPIWLAASVSFLSYFYCSKKPSPGASSQTNQFQTALDSNVISYSTSFITASLIADLTSGQYIFHLHHNPSFSLWLIVILFSNGTVQTGGSFSSPGRIHTLNQSSSPLEDGGLPKRQLIVISWHLGLCKMFSHPNSSHSHNHFCWGLWGFWPYVFKHLIYVINIKSNM